MSLTQSHNSKILADEDGWLAGPYPDGRVYQDKRAITMSIINGDDHEGRQNLGRRMKGGILGFGGPWEGLKGRR